jgi:hypothetical protein
VRRLVVLGASNLTRGFAAVVQAARAAWGEPLDVFGALGHGRSYGIDSRIFFRELPGILESGLWAQLDASPRVPSRALVTDVGNDILYHVPVETILGWMSECVRRLEVLGCEVILTDLPLFTLRELSPSRFLFFRSLFVPSCRLTQRQVEERAVEVSAGLVRLARDRGHTLVPLQPEWYGFDPIHIRPRYWTAAWRQILGAVPTQPPPGPRLGRLRLYLARPQRRSLFGFRQHTPQPALRTAAQTAVWLY